MTSLIFRTKRRFAKNFAKCLPCKNQNCKNCSAPAYLERQYLKKNGSWSAVLYLCHNCEEIIDREFGLKLLQEVD